jgi:SAM-dependent methyltransferase
MVIDSHPSVETESLQQEAIESLRRNRVEPKFLYVTPEQAAFWREVFLKHSPIHGNPEFTRIYQEAFVKIATELPAGKIRLVGLGCGTGQKEAGLYTRLIEHGHEIEFTAIDVSRDLVAESVEKLIAAGAKHTRSLVCDLAQINFLGEWLDGLPGDLPRIITFFGLFPNFAPSVITRLFHAVLRPSDCVLASAHLVPAGTREEISAGMKTILPQYDNLETLAWLAAAVKAWKLETRVDAPKMRISETEGIPTFLGEVRWKTQEPFEQWGRHFSPDTRNPLRLFSSLRYTPALFEDLLRGEGFAVDLLSLTACRQEGIWCIRPA